MGKDCGRGNAWAAGCGSTVAVNTSPKGSGGRVENFSRLPGLRISFEMSRIRAKGSLNKEILHVVIKHYITQLSSTNRVM